ncbi:hypothetical protein BJX76DRAFT_181938 [Aspergillus varians]
MSAWTATIGMSSTAGGILCRWVLMNTWMWLRSCAWYSSMPCCLSRSRPSSTGSLQQVRRRRLSTGFGSEDDGANELREAFWGAIPKWKQWNVSEATQIFLEWFRFGLFLKPEWRSPRLSEDEASPY